MQSLFFFYLNFIFIVPMVSDRISSMLVTVIQRKNSLLSLEKFDSDRYIYTRMIYMHNVEHFYA